MPAITWTEEEVDDLLALKKQGKPWASIARVMNGKYGKDISEEGYRSKYRHTRDKYPVATEHQEIIRLRESARLKKNNSQKSRESQLIHQHLNEQDDLVSRIEAAVSSIKLSKHKVTLSKPKKGIKHVVEVLISDVHEGKKTNDFNRQVLRQRLSKFASAVVQVVKGHNTDYILNGLLGDLIESQTMHGIHSARGCEFSTAEQIQFIIEDLWECYLLPICKLGVKIKNVAVAGNHDRDTSTREYHYPGKHNFTFIIYNTLRMLCKNSGFKHVSWDIPDKAYGVTEVYGKKVLFEHGDVISSINPESYEKLLQKRSKQLGFLVDFGRFGHLHTHMVYDSGRTVLNGGMPGGEGYSDTKGYTSSPGQTINLYSNEDKDNPFLYSKFIHC